MNILISAVLSIAFLVVVMKFLRRSSTANTDDALPNRIPTPRMGIGQWLDLSERIFDPGDARWLAEELAFPALAVALMEGRKHLAIRWLQALQASFDELARTPEAASDADSKAGLNRKLEDVVADRPLQAFGLVRLAGGQSIWPLPPADSVLFLGSVPKRKRTQFSTSRLGRGSEFHLRGL